VSNSSFPRMRYSDVVEQQVLDASGNFYATAAGAPTAELQAGAQTAAVSIAGCTQLDIFVNVTDLSTATKLYIKVRFSGKQTPSIATNTDWGYIQIDNIAGATGISSVQDYMIEIDLRNVNGVASANPRRYISRIQQISGRHASAIVWADQGTPKGAVYFMRQGGSM
jgi:hypothetical protein